MRYLLYGFVAVLALIAVLSYQNSTRAVRDTTPDRLAEATAPPVFPTPEPVELPTIEPDELNRAQISSNTIIIWDSDELVCVSVWSVDGERSYAPRNFNDPAYGVECMVRDRWLQVRPR